MLWQDRNGTWHSTLSGPDMLALSNTDQFIENCKEVATITGNLNLFEEMFGTDDDGRGQDSAFMDEYYGG